VGRVCACAERLVCAFIDAEPNFAVTVGTAQSPLVLKLDVLVFSIANIVLWASCSG
jgi:hypothetical protein